MYVKLFTQILDSSIADNRKLRHFFTDLLLCSDSKGFVIMTDAAIARRIGASLDEVSWGLCELQKPDPCSKTTDANGARIERLDGVGYGWRIINFEHYRSMKDADQLREATRERVRRYRAKKSSNGSVTPCNAGNANTEAEAEAEAEAEETPPNPQGEQEELALSLEDVHDENTVLVTDEQAFAIFWDAYPRKEGKLNAQKAWMKHIPDLNEVLEAVEQQRKSQQWTKDNGQFIPLPSSWLNAGGWMNEGIKIQPQKKPERDQTML